MEVGEEEGEGGTDKSQHRTARRVSRRVNGPRTVELEDKDEVEEEGRKTACVGLNAARPGVCPSKSARREQRSRKSGRGCRRALEENSKGSQRRKAKRLPE